MSIACYTDVVFTVLHSATSLSDTAALLLVDSASRARTSRNEALHAYVALVLRCSPRLPKALLKLLNTPGDERQVVLLYGSKSPDDILMKEQLDAWASKHANRFKLVHVLGGRSSRYTHGHSKQRSCRRTLTTLRQPGRTRAPLALSKADGSTRCAQCRDPPSALLAVTSGKSARWCQPLGACDGDISCFAMLLPEQVRGAVVGLSQRSAAIQPYGSV